MKGIVVTHLSAVLSAALLCSCALFDAQPKEWTGNIENLPPGSDYAAAVKAQQPEQAYVGMPNPQGQSSGLVDKIWHLLPIEQDNEPNPTSYNGPTTSVAEFDQSGWVWLDGAQKWQFTGNNMAQISPEQFTFEAEALVLRVNAPDLLNEYEGFAHPVVVKVIQLNDPKEFNSLKQDPFAVADMLVAKAIDPSFLQEDELFIAPNEEKVIKIDRAQDSRFVALVAGYYQLDEFKSVTRLIPLVPVAEVIDSGKLIDFWPFAEDQVIQRPGRLKLWLQLGELDIKELVIGVH